MHDKTNLGFNDTSFIYLFFLFSLDIKNMGNVLCGEFCQ
jgi:hypothetical protein